MKCAAPTFQLFEKIGVVRDGGPEAPENALPMPIQPPVRYQLLALAPHAVRDRIMYFWFTRGGSQLLKRVARHRRRIGAAGLGPRSLPECLCHPRRKQRLRIQERVNVSPSVVVYNSNANQK